MENSPCDNTICRTCMSKGRNFHSILEYESVSKLRIIEILMTTVPQLHIQPGADKLSIVICGVCLNKLNIAYQYQQLCIQTDGRLKAMLVHDKVDAIGVQQPQEQEHMDMESKQIDMLPNADTLLLNSNCIKVENEAEFEEFPYNAVDMDCQFKEVAVDMPTAGTEEDKNDKTFEKEDPNRPCYGFTAVNYKNNFDNTDAKTDVTSDEDDTELGLRNTGNKRCPTVLQSNNVENVSLKGSQSKSSPPLQNLSQRNLLQIEERQQTMLAGKKQLIPNPSFTQQQTQNVVTAAQPQINTLHKSHPQHSVTATSKHMNQQNKIAPQQHQSQSLLPFTRQVPNMQQYQTFNTPQQLNMQRQQQPQQKLHTQQHRPPQLYHCSTDEMDQPIGVPIYGSISDLVNMKGLNAPQSSCDIALLNQRFNNFEAGFNNKLDEFVKLMTSKLHTMDENTSTSATSRRNETTTPVRTSPFTLITNKAQFDNFIEYLGDQKYFNDLVTQCQRMWKSTMYKKRDYAYDLTDKMFSRPFLTQCSWAGGSTKGQEKINIKGKTILLQFYLRALSTVREITAKDVEAFLRSLLKNSAARSQAKGVRVSRQRETGRKRKVSCSHAFAVEQNEFVQQNESNDGDNEDGHDNDGDGQR